MTTNFGGTSAAAPVVSGVAGWIFSVAPEKSSQEVADLIISTAVQSPLITADENGHHDKYGYGVLNPVAIKDLLFPPEIEEENTKSSCSSFSTSPYLLSLFVLFPFLFTRRR